MNPVTGKLPRYHSKDLLVMVLCMSPVAVLLNYMLYGSKLFGNVGIFTFSLLATFVFLAIFFNSCGFVAVQLRNRFPTEDDLVKRILICLGIFYLMSALFISVLLFIYDSTAFFGYRYKQTDFYYAYLSAVVINTFITFLMEAIYRFEQLKEATSQTELLKKECMNSKLLGLKSQVNPHFLFNSLNSLSSLIQEDGDKAELFLNHMSKVYRYLLRYRDEALVELDKELAFIRSFYYLLKQRHGDGIVMALDIPVDLLNRMIAPLTLQVFIENTVSGNTVSKECPLSITITAAGDTLIVINSVQCKINNTADATALENVMHKYQLLCEQPMTITESDRQRIISIPLMAKKEIIAV